MLNDYYRHQADLVLTVLGYMDWDSCFAMKGGTALNFFYENMPRLSVDIDLVYLPVRSREQSLAEMKEELSNYVDDFTKRGFLAEIIGINKDNPVGKLYVSNKFASIKIEPNPVVRGTVLPTQMKYLSPAVKQTFQQEINGGVRCLDYNEIIGGKLVAMLDRQHPRDVFDMLNYYENKDHLRDVMDLFVIYLVQANRSFSEVLSPNLQDMEKLFKTNFTGMTQEPTDLNKLIVCREKALRDLRQSLETRHKEFIISFMRGAPRWELMPFEHLDQLPGMKWRLQNLQAISDIKREEEIAKIREALVFSL